MDEYADSPEKDADGKEKFISYQLLLDDYTQAVVKKKKSDWGKKYIDPSEDADYKYENALHCYSKSVVDKFRLKPDSAEVKKWEDSIKQEIKKREDEVDAMKKAGQSQASI